MSAKNDLRLGGNILQVKMNFSHLFGAVPEDGCVWIDISLTFLSIRTWIVKTFPFRPSFAAFSHIVTNFRQSATIAWVVYAIACLDCYFWYLPAWNTVSKIMFLTLYQPHTHYTCCNFFSYMMKPKQQCCSELGVSPFSPKAITSLRLSGTSSPLSIWTTTYLPDTAWPGINVGNTWLARLKSNLTQLYVAHQ